MKGEISIPALAEVIDSQEIQALMEDFYELAHIPMSIIDLEGKVLVGVGWQEICIKFHRIHPETCKNCIESDTKLSAGVPQGEKGRLFVPHGPLTPRPKKSCKGRRIEIPATPIASASPAML